MSLRAPEAAARGAWSVLIGMYIPRWKLISYALILLLGVASAMPNLLTPEQLSRLPAWIGDSRVTLGLDLKGGSHLALEVDADALVSERLEALAGEARQRLAEAGVAAEDRKSTRLNSSH